MAKPPPPVPPRPSKTIIAEALAKTKKVAEASPLRIAPSPPVVAKPTETEGVARSNSSVNVLLKKPGLDRSISEEIKTTTRTIVFQSSSMNKSSKVQVNQAGDSQMVVNDSASNESANNAHSETQNCTSDNNSVKAVSESAANKLDKNWNEILNDRNHVNTLIDEMFASVLEIPDDTPVETTNNYIVHHANKNEKGDGPDQKKQPTVLVINQNVDDDCSSKTSGEDSKSNSSTSERKHVKFDDKQNHELLISELESMKKEQQRILKRQRKPSQEIYDENAAESPKIQHSDWVEVNNGEEVRLSSCQITIEDFKKTESSKALEDDIISRLATMSSLHGLPPLPKSLSGFSLLEDSALSNAPGSSRGATPPAGHYSPHSKVNGNDVSPNLDAQLAILRREMVSLLLP